MVEVSRGLPRVLQQNCRTVPSSGHKRVILNLHLFEVNYRLPTFLQKFNKHAV